MPPERNPYHTLSSYSWELTTTSEQIVEEVVLLSNRDLTPQKEVCSMPTTSPEVGAPEKGQM